MNSSKKVALIFLTAINIMNLAAGIITETKIAFNGDVTSIIPITAQMTVNQILLLNFAVVVAIMLLISIVTTYLATDVPYSPLEILSNCAGIFMVLPVIISVALVINAVNADISADKIWIIVSGIFYLIACVIDVSCILTVREDMD